MGREQGFNSGGKLLAAWAGAFVCMAPVAFGALEVLSPWRDGIGTFYGGAPDGMDPNSPSFGTSVGSCGYGMLDKETWPFWSVAALPTSNIYFNSLPVEGCGSCFEIHCEDRHPFAGRCNPDESQRSVLVQITDQCPECGEDHIDMQAKVFEKIAPPGNGRVSIRYRRVSCHPPGKVVIRVDTFNAGSWMRFSIMNVAGFGTLDKVEMKGPDSSWVQVKNLWGAAWELGVTPSPPLRFRLTDENGEVLETGELLNSGSSPGDYTAGVQFSTRSSKVESSDADFSKGEAGATPAADGPVEKATSAEASPDASGAAAEGQGFPFNADTYVNRLDMVFRASSGSNDAQSQQPASGAPSRPAIDALKARLADQKSQQQQQPAAATIAAEADQDKLFASSAVWNLGDFWGKLRNNTVQAIGSRGSVSAQPGTVVVKESFSSQQKASKFGAVEHQIPAPDISYGIEKVPLAPVFSSAVPLDASGKVPPGEVEVVGAARGQEDPSLIPLSTGISLTDGVQVQGFAGPATRGFKPGTKDIKLDVVEDTKGAPRAEENETTDDKALSLTDIPGLEEVLVKQGRHTFIKLLDLSPSFLDVLSKASRDEPNLGLTILVPPESALQDLLGDVTSSARRLDSFLFRHLVSEPLALSKMAALGRVQTAEAAALKVAPCDKCKAPGSFMVGGWRVDRADVDAGNLVLHFLGEL